MTTNFQKLPFELQIQIVEEAIKDHINAHVMVYNNAVSTTPPSLLSAPDPPILEALQQASTQNLHLEAVSLFAKSTFGEPISADAFKKIHFKEVNHIRHLTIVAPVVFRSMKICLQNNLERLTLDFTDTDAIYQARTARSVRGSLLGGKLLSYPESIVQMLISASKSLHLIVVKISAIQSPHDSTVAYHEDMRLISGVIGIESKIAKRMENGREIHCFIWRKEDGSPLTKK